jgi:hypothetical protein
MQPPSELTGPLETLGLGPEQVELLRVMPALDVEPSSTALRIYLDLNHWISLAKARVGRQDGQPFLSCYQLLRQGVQNRDLVIPLSAAHYMELSQTRSLRHRTDLANVMSELSQFTTLAGYGSRLQTELEAALFARAGALTPRPNRPVLGRGVGFAFDLGDGSVQREVNNSRWPWSPLKAAPRMTLSQTNELEHLRTMRREYLVLRGPRPEDVGAIPDYHPELVQQSTLDYVRREQELADLLNQAAAPAADLDDVLHARYLYRDLQPTLPDLLARIGMSHDLFLGHGKEWISELLDDLPTAVVHMGLARQIFKNKSHVWVPNDIRDIDAMSCAVPDCDVVVTENHACDVLRRSRIDQQFGTLVTSRLSDLEAHLH